MSQISSVNGFYQKLEAYKTSLRNNRPSNMTDTQFNSQIDRYMLGLQHDELKLSKKVEGKNFAKNLAMDKNGQAIIAEQAEMIEFEKAVQYEKEWLEASRQPKEVQGRPVDKNRADSIKKRQNGSNKKGEMRQQAHIDAQMARAEAGNSSPLKRAKIKKRARKQQYTLNKQIEQNSPTALQYQEKIETKRINRRIKNNTTKPKSSTVLPSNSGRKTVEETVESVIKKQSSKFGTKGILVTAGTAIALVCTGIFMSKKEKSEENSGLRLTA